MVIPLRSGPLQVQRNPSNTLKGGAADGDRSSQGYGMGGSGGIGPILSGGQP
jgi:hypothetical protein